MKYLIYLLFLYTTIGFGQQTIELCPGEQRIVTYFTDNIGVGINLWSINGETFVTNELNYVYRTYGTYTVKLIRENVLCRVEDSLIVNVIPCPQVIYWIPNTFTPDNDEHNQTFRPIFNEGIDVDGFYLVIYNRWGQIIWETNNLNGEWDGTYGGNKCSDGIYIWKLMFGVKNTDEKRIDYGHLTIIR